MRLYRTTYLLLADQSAARLQIFHTDYSHWARKSRARYPMLSECIAQLYIMDHKTVLSDWLVCVDADGIVHFALSASFD